jgi:hypothetical protein
VADGLGLLLERDAVLIVVAAILDLPALGEEILREPEVTRIAGLAVERRQAHVVRRTHGTAQHIGRTVAQCAREEVRRLARDREQVRFAGCLVMDARRAHQVAEIVELEVVTILEGRSVGVAVALTDEHRRVQIAVGALRLRDDSDAAIQAAIKVVARRDRLHGAGGFDELVELAVVERRAA